MTDREEELEREMNEAIEYLMAINAVHGIRVPLEKKISLLDALIFIRGKYEKNFLDWQLSTHRCCEQIGKINQKLSDSKRECRQLKRQLKKLINPLHTSPESHSSHS